MVVMQCEKCKEIYDVIYGKGLICTKCGHRTKDAIVNGLVKRR
jgi:rRNA maturation endonuclease Nob1